MGRRGGWVRFFAALSADSTDARPDYGTQKSRNPQKGWWQNRYWNHESHESTRIGVVGTRKKIREDSWDSWLKIKGFCVGFIRSRRPWFPPQWSAQQWPLVSFVQADNPHDSRNPWSYIKRSKSCSIFLSRIIELEIEKMKYFIVHPAHSIVLLSQEIIVEILRGNKTWSNICRDKPPAHHLSLTNNYTAN